MSYLIYEKVRTDLHLSEGDAYEETHSAMKAVAEFASLECEFSEEGFLDLARKVWLEAQEGKKT